MVNKLRRKFVVVTVLMMTLLFAFLWAAGRIYQEYWFDQEMLTVVEVLSDSGIFGDKDINGEMIVESLTDEEPVIYIKADSEGRIFSKQLIGGGEPVKRISADTVQKMLKAGSEGYKADGYIFSKRKTNDGYITIVAIDSNIHDGSFLRIIGRICLILIGVGLLVLITFCLSGFVTLPAKEALEREKRFVSDAGHELKTPLGAISINAQALELNGSDSVYIRNILSEAGRMNRLIESLLTLSRLEEGTLREKKAFLLSEIVQEIILTYESTVFEKGRTLSSSIQEGVMLYGDEDEIRQLMAILLDNAIKNSDEGGKIELCCSESEGHKKITVSNSGQGIRSEDIGHIFERFYTTDRSRNKGSFGLGLAIAKEIVERHDGDITVSSIPDKETVFTVTF